MFFNRGSECTCLRQGFARLGLPSHDRLTQLLPAEIGRDFGHPSPARCFQGLSPIKPLLYISETMISHGGYVTAPWYIFAVLKGFWRHHRSKVLITASGGLRGPKAVELKQIADNACKLAEKEGFKVGSTLPIFSRAKHIASQKLMCPLLGIL